MVDFIPFKKVFQLFTDPDSARRCARDDSDHSDSSEHFLEAVPRKGMLHKKGCKCEEAAMFNNGFFLLIKFDG